MHKKGQVILLKIWGGGGGGNKLTISLLRLRPSHIKQWNMFTKAALQCYAWELTANNCFLN